MKFLFGVLKLLGFIYAFIGANNVDATTYCTTCSGCQGATNITITPGTTVVEDRAFYQCFGLVNVYIPWGVVTIGDYAFYGISTSLKTLFIADSVTTVGDSAFAGLSVLVNATMSSGVTSVGKGIFGSPSKYVKITPSYVVFDQQLLFYFCPSGVQTVTFPANITSIGPNVFYGCWQLTHVSVPSSVVSIGSYAFAEATGMRTIDLPPNLTVVSDYTFQSSGLRTITVPYGVVSLGSYAFFSSKYLWQINLPSSLTNISASCFYICTGLKNITIPSSVWFIGYGAFDQSGLTNIVIPPYSGNDGKVQVIDESVFYQCLSLVNVTLPDSLTVLSDYLFSGCTSLVNVNIPSSLTYLGRQAFRDCSSLAVDMVIPIGVKTIFSYTFTYCSSLPSVTFTTGLMEIEYYAFQGCTSLKSAVFPATNQWGTFMVGYNAFQQTGLINITLPSTMTIIKSYTFANCVSLRSVSIPSSVTYIASYAFSGDTVLSCVTWDQPEGATVGAEVFQSCPTNTCDSFALTTVSPTVQPTPKLYPTQFPTVSNAPTTSRPSSTGRPSATPTSTSPSLAAPTSLAPSTIQSVAPSLTPVSVLPTIPSFVAYVVFDTVQTFSNISYSTYLTNTSNYDRTIKAAVAASMNGTTPTDIDYLVVSECSSVTGCDVSASRVLSAAIPQISSTYTVFVGTDTVPGATYTSLSTQLGDAVSSGHFDTLLNSFAVEYGAAGMESASSNALITTNEVTNDDNSGENNKGGGSNLNLALVIGLACGGFVLLLAFGYFVYFKVCKARSDADNTQNKHASAAPAVTNSDHAAESAVAVQDEENFNPLSKKG